MVAYEVNALTTNQHPWFESSRGRHVIPYLCTVNHNRGIKYFKKIKYAVFFEIWKYSKQ